MAGMMRPALLRTNLNSHFTIPATLTRSLFTKSNSINVKPSSSFSSSSVSHEISSDFCRAIPKADLHVHLDGSLRPATILDIAKREKIELPPLPNFPDVPTQHWTPEMLRTLFQPHYASLVDYLRPFAYTTAVMQSPEALEQTAAEFLEDCADDNVCYVEVRFAPQLLSHKDLDIRAVLRHINQGFSAAKAKINAKRRLIKVDRPPMMEYGIIACAMRSFQPEFSKYYQRLCASMPSMPLRKKAGLASLALTYEIIASREIDGVPVVALDIAGAEAGFPATDHIDAFRLAHKNFIHATVHAGEAYGPESIYQAVVDLYATRIGHGYHLFHPDAIENPKIRDPQRYVDNLLTFIGETRTTLEVCLTSNIQTMPHLNHDLRQHSCKKMLDYHLNVALSTDNTLVSGTTVSRELKLAVDAFNLDWKALRGLVMNSFKSSFFQGSYREKKKYIEEVEAYYDRIEQIHKPVTITESAEPMGI